MYKQEHLQDAAFVLMHAFPLLLSLTQSKLAKMGGSRACNFSVYTTNERGRQAVNPAQISSHT